MNYLFIDGACPPSQALPKFPIARDFDAVGWEEAESGNDERNEETEKDD